ncbi:hypothetical protein MUCCIDRAFT_114150 [Mucor lusitanicus CBS 277.49]|uniref:Uncharacterized protein n=1 Tax=Mucor lusitanicus CBS 277.49 TaxID=747725 RepID=A0A168HN40_MUCCL|nr:hypothetical protein MUCCIDRAFT_114150 [Mucor lusitanicus CBS 277.49]
MDFRTDSLLQEKSNALTRVIAYLLGSDAALIVVIVLLTLGRKAEFMNISRRRQLDVDTSSSSFRFATDDEVNDTISRALEEWNLANGKEPKDDGTVFEEESSLTNKMTRIQIWGTALPMGPEEKYIHSSMLEGLGLKNQVTMKDYRQILMIVKSLKVNNCRNT